MQSIKRTDTHRPSAINPTEYAFIAYEMIPGVTYGPVDLGACAYLQTQREILRSHMNMTGGTYSNHEHGGNCHICGAHCIYTVIFYHRATNSYIRTGNDCAEKLDMSQGDFNAFRMAVKEYTELQAGKRKAQGVLHEALLDDVWVLYMERQDTMGTPNPKWFNYEETTILDIVGKLIRYGSISEGQKNLVRRLLDRIAQRPVIVAQRAAEVDAAAPVPTGRIEVTGTILSTKHDFEGAWPVHKMLVKADTGFKVWGTIPASLAADKGARVAFVATVTPSPNDPKFGFFSRPTKARLLDVPVATQA